MEEEEEGWKEVEERRGCEVDAGDFHPSLSLYLLLRHPSCCSSRRILHKVGTRPHLPARSRFLSWMSLVFFIGMKKTCEKEMT